MIHFLTAVLSLQASGEPVDFKQDIRPILSDNCFQCHGPDAQHREAELRLDTREAAFAVKDGVAAFVAGNPRKSSAYQRMITKDADDLMPPRKTGKKLTAMQLDLVRRWIEQGGAWSEHWAFVPPERSPAPKTARRDWGRNPLDAFVLARLEKEGLAPSPEADRPTLLRRLSLDLTGLPPTAAELDAFLADASPDAYERQVERLLASPHHGERWGRHWLDAARYADSDGYEKDKPRFVWFYRDWVIRAHNEDLPYDRFIVEQIAGDLLPNPTQDQIVATGFLRNSMINEEGGVDPEQFRMEAMFDRMDAIGKAVLGLTISCCQCHSHKYDAITQNDYYRMFAFLNNAHESASTVYTPDQQRRRADVLRGIREAEEEFRHRTPDWKERMAAWEERVRAVQAEWTVVRPSVDDISTGGQKYLPQPDGSFLAQGYAPTKHRVKLTVKVDAPEITGFRLELLNDPNLPHGGPGRSIKGTAALTEFEVEAGPADGSAPPRKLRIAAATADLEMPEAPLEALFDDRSKKKRVTGPVAFAVDGKDETAWTTDAGPGRRNRPRNAVFVPEAPVKFPGGAVLVFHLKQNHGGWNSDDNQNFNLGRLRLSVTSTPAPAADSPVRAILAIPSARRSPAQAQAVFSAWLASEPAFAETQVRIEDLWKTHPEGASQLTLEDRSEPRSTRMLERGDFLKPREAVEPGVPAILNPFPEGAPKNRLGFARWLVDRKAPTTARALVNRVWQAYFGTGFISTPEELGSQGEQPSHPELLDWLSVEFMERGWSLKRLHRLIVGSSTYRQESRVSPDRLAKDPFNRLLSRGSRFRVEGEIVRDIALAVSGLLNPAVGGASVYPPAPAALFVPPASYGPKVWDEEKGEARYRRAVYTFRYRSVPYPVLQAFDAPNGDFSCVRRPRSNTPLQALTALNEPLFLECAREFAARALQEGGPDDAARLDWAFRRCTARRPSPREREILLGFLAKQKERFEGAQESLRAFAGADAAPERGAWTALARVLLNLDETITRE
jgi:hypothetical protein